MNDKRIGQGLTLCVAALFVLLTGCATMNVIADGADEQLMLRGNDPVAYQTENRALPGSAEIRATTDADRYRFVSEASRKLFHATLQLYVPAYGGYCASGAPYALIADSAAGPFNV